MAQPAEKLLVIPELRTGSMSLGALETISEYCCQRVSGIIGAAILAAGRALGETGSGDGNWQLTDD